MVDVGDEVPNLEVVLVIRELHKPGQRRLGGYLAREFKHALKLQGWASWTTVGSARATALRCDS